MKKSPIYVANKIFESDIDLKNWHIIIDRIKFGEPRPPYFLSWFNENINPQKFPHTDCEQKLYPALIYTSARYSPEPFKDTPNKNLDNCKKKTKNLFLKFYNKDSLQILLDVSIVAKPYKNFNRRLFMYSSKNYCWLPNNIPNYPMRYYEFLLPDFWIKNKIYKREITVKDRKKEYICSPFELNWEAIFLCIWENYIKIESSSTIMDRSQFMDYLGALAELAIDIISHPISNMDKEDFKKKLLCFSQNRDPADCRYLGMNSARWKKRIPRNKNDIFEFRVLDSKDYLNAFLKKYNYSTMKNALELFLIKMFESLGDELIKKQLLTKCALCGEYFRFTRAKKYCSLFSEDKDCGKKARNKRYYQTRGKKRLHKYRQITQELRALYKERGIEKIDYPTENPS